MPVNRRGLEANQSTPPEILSGGIKGIPDLKTELENKIRYGRVIDVVLETSFPNISKIGGTSAIGGIYWEDVYRLGDKQFAIPLFPQLSSPPLVNELVLIFSFPSRTSYNNPDSKDFYYICPANIWNTPHTNPIPSSFINPTSNKSYQEIEGGSPKIAENTISTNQEPMGVSKKSGQINTFVERTPAEKNFIFPLLPFAGDTIFQGRWGNSIRLGSTAYVPGFGGESLNPWSEFGDNGDPIIVIRNGQNPNLQEGSYEKKAVEDVNFDASSIYLTSTQNIPFFPSNQNYTPSYTSNVPTVPNNYQNPQAIINSGRLVFNSKDDHTLISSKKSIFLGANTSVNVSTRETIINSRNIRLGSKDAEEPIIKGEIFLNSLSLIMNELSVVCSVLKNLQEVDTVDVNSGKPIKSAALKGNLRSKCLNLESMIKDFVENADTYKSKVNKII